MAEIKGTVKWFNVNRGFGFITAEDGQEHFVHFSDIEQGRHYTGFEAGDKVTFELKETAKGLKAAKVVMTEMAQKPVKEIAKEATE